MRIAAMIISILMSVFIFVQSALLLTAGGIGASLSSSANDAAQHAMFSSTVGAASVGLLVGFLYFVGGAFVLKLPTTACAFYILGAGFAFLVGLTSNFQDMIVYGVIGLIFFLMSMVSRKSAKAEKLRAKNMDAFIASQTKS